MLSKLIFWNIKKISRKPLVEADISISKRIILVYYLYIIEQDFLL